MQKTQKNVLQRRIIATVENIFARPNSAWGIIFYSFFWDADKNHKNWFRIVDLPMCILKMILSEFLLHKKNEAISVAVLNK